MWRPHNHAYVLTGTCTPNIRIFSRISIDLVLAVWRGDTQGIAALILGAALRRPDWIGGRRGEGQGAGRAAAQDVW